jgi:hypothetical protein
MHHRPSRGARFGLAAILALALTSAVAVATASPTITGHVRLAAADLQAPATTQSAVSGPACPDVMVIAARGSGERPQANWTDPAAYTDPATAYGAGPINYDFYQRLYAAKPQLHFALDSVMYPAASIPSLVRDGIVAYHASEQSAVSAILDDVARTERICGGGVKYVFSGYSQGAWAVHEALYKLARSAPQVMGKIVGVALFGDPEFIPDQPIIRDNKLLLRAEGVARIPAPFYLPDGYTNVPPMLRSITASYCLFLDGVCQATPANVASTAAACLTRTPDPYNPLEICQHARYIVDGKTAKAAKFVIPNLPPKSVWPRLTLTSPPVGTVDQPYSWTATAAPTARTTYTWEALDPLPPDLTFSRLGVLSGTPKNAGTFTFRVRATSVPQGRYIAGPVTVTINPGSGVGAGTWATVSTGDSSTCAIRTDGTLWCWGGNGDGGLGVGDTNDRLTPTQVGSATTWASVSTAKGDDYTCATRTDGTLWCWGDNVSGQLGTGDTKNRLAPVQVGTAATWASVSVTNGDGATGDQYTCATRTDGTLWCWGGNGAGQLGTGDTSSQLIPTQVGTATTWASVSAGWANACATRTDGTLWCWGDNTFGQLGTGDTTARLIPTEVG